MSKTDVFSEDINKNSFDDVGLTEIADYYKMNHFRRGTAIIFNHYEFDGDVSVRNGTFKDAEDLKEVLKELKFDVAVYTDLKYGTIYDIITNLAKLDHADADCLLIAILSHGDADGKVHARDNPYPPDFIWKTFAGDKCPTLAGKPKLFFIQACRGDEIDDGTRIRNAIRADSQKMSYTIPVMADILVMYSSYSGYFSWRSPKNGSWFVQCLCAELKLRTRKNDLLTILTFVNRRMAISYNSMVPYNEKMNQKKQIGTVVSTLTRLLCFYPIDSNYTSGKYI